MSVVTATRPVRAPARREDERRSTQRHLRVVGAPRGLGRRLVTTAVLVGLFVVLLGAVAFHVRLVQGQQRIDRLNQQAQQAQERYDNLRVQVDRLSAPTRIVSKAEAFGMTQADHPTWLAPSQPGEDPKAGDSSSLQRYLDVKPYLNGTS